MLLPIKEGDNCRDSDNSDNVGFLVKLLSMYFFNESFDL